MALMTGQSARLRSLLEHLREQHEEAIRGGVWARSFDRWGIVIMGSRKQMALTCAVAKFLAAWLHMCGYETCFGADFGTPGLATLYSKDENWAIPGTDPDSLEALHQMVTEWLG
jgi:hypothetical protein